LRKVETATLAKRTAETQARWVRVQVSYLLPFALLVKHSKASPNKRPTSLDT